MVVMVPSVAESLLFLTWTLDIWSSTLDISSLRRAVAGVALGMNLVLKWDVNFNAAASFSRSLAYTYIARPATPCTSIKLSIQF